MTSNRSIRSKLLIWIVFALTFILFTYSVIVLNTQKKNIIKRHVSSALALAQTAAIPLVEEFLFSSNDYPVSDDFLQNYLNQLWESNTADIKFIVLLDQQGKVRAHTKVDEYGRIYEDIYTRSAIYGEPTQTHIYNDPSHGWILEAASIIGISSKHWGVIRIGFQADTLRGELLSAFWGNFIMSVLTVLAIILATYLITSNLTRKLVQTATIVDSIDLRNDDLVDFPDSNDEIGRLNEKFHSMQLRLISSRKQIEEASHNLIQAEKLAAVGRLASGVAHEINNPLMGMKNCLYLIQANPDDAENRNVNLGFLDEGLERIGTIVQNLLGSVRKPMQESHTFSVNKSIIDVAELLAYRLSTSKVLLTMDLDDELQEYTGNRVRLEEALLNLLLNALDAVGDVGSIVITTASANGNIEIAIRDSGPGIPFENREKIFEPFFTSKEVGKGTGLGLYVTREILSEMGADIHFTTETEGITRTTFTITLPAQ